MYGNAPVTIELDGGVTTCLLNVRLLDWCQRRLAGLDAFVGFLMGVEGVMSPRYSLLFVQRRTGRNTV